MTSFLIALVFSYLYHGYGITVGYHRLLSHRSFKVPMWLEYLIVSGGYLCFEGSPVSWVATHRVHHRFSDREGDPHTPVDGFWHSWGKWLYEPKVVLTNEQIEQTVPDLWRDPVYRALDFDHTRKHALVCLIACIVVRVLLFVAFGPWALLGNLVGSAMTFTGPFWVNSICHLKEWGYRNFNSEDGSRNVPWVGFWALGEGWHNNHHAVPQSARHGIKPHEVDISWMFISLLSALGLATNIRLPKEPKSAPAIEPEFSALLARMSAKEKIVAGAEPIAELIIARDQLLAQLNDTKAMAGQLNVACDQLSEQIAAAKQHVAEQLATARTQLSGQLLAAREQAAEQILATCDELAEQVEQAKLQIEEKVRGACEQLSDKLMPQREAETV